MLVPGRTNLTKSVHVVLQLTGFRPLCPGASITQGGCDTTRPQNLDATAAAMVSIPTRSERPAWPPPHRMVFDM